jgi:hypothetical protein
MFERLNGCLSTNQERPKFAEYKIRVLEERLWLIRIEKYGPGSEKLSGHTAWSFWNWSPESMKLKERPRANERN